MLMQRASEIERSLINLIKKELLAAETISIKLQIRVVIQFI